MADLFASGFETGDLTEWTGSNETPTVGSTAHCGSYGCNFNLDSEYASQTIAAQTEVYCRIYVRLSDVPPTDQSYYARLINFLGDSGADSTCRVYFNYLKNENKYGVRLARFYPANVSTLYNFTWEVDTWYCLELYFKKDASDGEYKVWLDGNLIINETGLDTSGSHDIDTVHVGTDFLTPGWTVTATIDCAVIANSGPITTHDNSFEATFETADFSNWDATEGSPSIQALRRHCGVYALESEIGQYAFKGPYINLGHQKDVFCQFEVQFDDLPASGESVEFVRFMRDSTSMLKLKIENDSGTVKWGFIYLAAGSETEVLSGTSTDPDADEWYCIGVQIRCSHIDGQAVGIYRMWVDGTELADITQTSKDTDYTGVNVLKLRAYTDMAGGTTVYGDCVLWQSTSLPACHDAGSEDVTSYAEEADCTPATTGKILEVFRNCVPLDVVGITVNEQMRGTSTITLPYHVSVERGDLFHVFAEGATILQGKAIGIHKQRRRGVKTVTCQNKTARLYGRYVLNSSHRSYLGYDAGAIAADLVEYYFYGLFTTDNIDTNTGTTITEIDLYEKTVGDALEELAKRAGAYFYVDNNNDVHFFVEGAETTGITIQEKDIIDIDNKEVGLPLSKIIIKGYGVSAESGSGIPEKMHSDRRIGTSAEAQEVADRYRDLYEVQTTGSITTKGFFTIRHGQTIVVDSILDGYDNETLVVNNACWSFAAGQWETTVRVGNPEPNLKFALAEMQKQIEETAVNRISTHIGIETSDSDPVQVYTDVIDVVAGAQVQVNGTGKLLQSQAAASEADAVELAYVETVIAVGGGGGNGEARIYVDVGGSELHSWDVKYDANLTTQTLTCFLPRDFSGETVRVYADGDAGANVWLTATLKVRQFVSHSHSVSQAQSHEFD